MKLIITLLTMSASGLILAALLFIMGRLFFARLSPSLCYYAWLIVLLRMVLPLPGLVVTAEPETPAPAQYAVTEESTGLPTPRGIADGYWAGTHGFINVPELRPAAETGNTAAAASHSEASTDFSALSSWLGRILREPALYIGAWVFGMALYLINSLLSLLRFRALLFGDMNCAEPWEYELLKKLCPGRRPSLYRSKAIASPILIGLIKPRLILPLKSSSRETLENILRHELTHYRRRDLWYKHFILLVSATHWFNPLMPLIRREIERCCELSCDERVLNEMDASRRKSYGETLLRCAADNALPARLAVSSFSVQKRQLKERLEQVLKFKKKGPAAIIASLLVLSLLCGCGAVLGPAKENAPEAPAPTPEPTSPVVTGIGEEATAEVIDGQEVYKVSSAAELLAAIGPDRVISMAEGSYVLSMVKDYGSGSSDYYYWRESVDGYELVIQGVKNMRLVSESPSSANDPAVLLLTEPRYANVLCFDTCAGISISGLSVGHIEGGLCSGGVLHMNACDDMAVYDSKLFGCGTVALQCRDCDGVMVENSLLTDCSQAALEARYSRAIEIRGCDVKLNGASPALFSFSSSEDSVIAECNISGNQGLSLLRTEGSRNISLLSSQIRGNTFDCMFSVPEGFSVTVDGCELSAYDNSSNLPWIATAGTVQDSEGNILGEAELKSMVYEQIPYDLPVEKIVDYAEGEVHVSNVEELLAAIAPNVTIYLEEGDYDLSEAPEYGGYGNDYYSWEQRHDGPSLLIFNCENLSIIGAGSGKTNIYARPRYADIFHFNNCDNLTLSGFTAGHVEEPGYCSGDVIKLQHSDNVSMEDLGLFGCGYIGINAFACKNMSLKSCDIYECTGSAINANNCEGLSIEDSTVRDILGVGMHLNACLGLRIKDSGFARLCTEGGSNNPVLFAVTESSNITVEGCSFFESGDNSCVVFDNCKSVEVKGCSSDIPGFDFCGYNESSVHVDGVHHENHEGHW